MVDQQRLNAIRAELDFQMSGEVDDDTAQELGRMAGAQIIVRRGFQDWRFVLLSSSTAVLAGRRQIVAGKNRRKNSIDPTP
jgi:hypothetical protein